MKRKILITVGATMTFLLLLINLNLIVQNNDLNISLKPVSAFADFDPCPPDPIPWHCSYHYAYEVCFYSNRCLMYCPTC